MVDFEDDKYLQCPLCDFETKYTQFYPAIIVPHGGPTDQYYRSFNLLGQVLANKGYIAMFPNVRGSTGYGVKFKNACIKDWGGKDLDDWVAGRKWLIENGADPDRIGMYGGSYGGYATLISLTKKPELWKAGVCAAGLSHLKSAYDSSSSHYQNWLESQMGDPIENLDLWEERSPLNYAHQLKSSLLLIH